MTTEPARPAVAVSPADLDRPAPGAGGRRARTWLLYAVLLLGLVVTAGPFLWMMLASVKPNAEIQRRPPSWLPEVTTLENYEQLFNRLDFPTYFMNSVIVAVSVTVGNLVVCSMLGYALAKMDFPGKRLLFGIVLAVLMVPGIALFVPQFVLVSKLNMVNTYQGIILPILALMGPFGVFLMRQFISGLPDELIEAARVDGAGEFRIFAQVIAPLCKPAFATLGILTFLQAWNNFLWPLAVAQTEDKYVLPVGLALFTLEPNRGVQYGLLMAGAVVVVMPVIVVFLLLQRHFVQGVAMTGIK
jgi:multiple sugar transport system permease protein